MNSKVRTYLVDSLAACGFAVVNYLIALNLREDLWASAGNARTDFFDATAKIHQFLGSLARVRLFELRFVDQDDWLLVASRSDDALAERIRWLTGMDVAAVRLFNPTRQAAEARKQSATEIDPLPPYPCAERTRILEERGERDAKFDSATKFPPRRQGL